MYPYILSFKSHLSNLSNLPPYLTPGSSSFRKFIRRLVLTLYHPAGTCRMGRESDKMACCDSELRLRGVRDLRIVDASIMPVLPSGNTQVPVMMIGEMAAEILANTHHLVEG